MGKAAPRPRYPITPRRLSMKAVVAGVVSAVLLAVLCIAGLVVSMSDGRAGQPAAAPAAPNDQPSPQGSRGGQPNHAAPAPAKTTPPAPPKQNPPPTIVTMPDVVGLNAAVAEDRLNKAGLKNLKFASGDERYRFVLVVKNWTVTKQSTPAGARIDKDTLIVLTCVKP